MSLAAKAGERRFCFVRAGNLRREEITGNGSAPRGEEGGADPGRGRGEGDRNERRQGL